MSSSPTQGRNAKGRFANKWQSSVGRRFLAAGCVHVQRLPSVCWGCGWVRDDGWWQMWLDQTPKIYRASVWSHIVAIWHVNDNPRTHLEISYIMHWGLGTMQSGGSNRYSFIWKISIIVTCIAVMHAGDILIVFMLQGVTFFSFWLACRVLFFKT